MSDVSLLAWRYFKLPRKTQGANNAETQAVAFGDESLWLTRLMWAEIHGCTIDRWNMDATVREVPGMLITDSRGIFDAISRSEPPQLGLRSSRTGEEARAIKEQFARTCVSFRWVNTLAMLADIMTKPGYPARHVLEDFLATGQWKCVFR